MLNGVTSSFFLLIGGLGIFVYGIHLTSDGLQKLAGAKMKWVLMKLTKNRFIGTLVGAGTTAVLQSSSFMSVMIVGLASARLLNLTQAASLIVGMNVGTTITAQIIALQVSAFALPIVAVGVYLNLFSKREGWHFGGQTLMGLGMLFLGLTFMKDAFAPLSKNPAFYEFFVTYGSNIFLAVLFGIVATLIIQSSSAIIGITIALASSGMLALPASIAIVLGSNIGTTLTAQIAALHMNRTAKRAALLHTVFNLVGVVWVMFVFSWFVDLVEWVTPHDASFIAEDGSYPYMARHIANAHTVFNLMNALVFLVILPYVVKLIERILPQRKTNKPKGMVTLHKGYLKNPEIALMQSKLAAQDMFRVVRSNFDSCKLYLKGPKNEAAIFKNEKMVNQYRIDISQYLGKLLTMSEMTEAQAQKIPVFLHLVNDIEAMGDCSKQIVEEVRTLYENSSKLTKSEIELLVKLFDDLQKYLKSLGELLMKPDRDKVIALEEDLITFRRNKLDKAKATTPYMTNIIGCLHDFVRKMSNLLVMTREV